ncbi:uncharacterized protein SCHCODRAFT_02584841 [Schizophyllum commune H4-8]|uniref:Uncharacterized protein n=1 Tax=Schizophyllum commune (strain H4-8 / FGSC 9210) TaxID=578458 RepID=D8QB39_SCHCM|nr:uncharacterized protein SCHCODRAFT_02584841 [Schizophyllum commune H4-8]KAI5889023.1 hypothetical protein SCHCODRAFT_02584841 [Schizophyllum commune H4-8]
MLGMRAAPLDLDGAYQVPLATKTPGKNMKRENAYPPATVNGKARTLISQTPFKPGTIQPERMKDAGPSKATKTPFGDKTPFPNRLRPQLFSPSQDAGPKLQKPNFVLEVVPDGNARPSSTRKNARPRSSLTKAFQTPANRGDWWNVPEDDLMSPENSVQEIAEEELFDFDEEIEYMPPNTLDLPYVPPFDFEMPDYKKIGAAVTEIMHCYAYVDVVPTPDPTFDEKDLANDGKGLAVPMERLLPDKVPEDEEEPTGKRTSPAPSSKRTSPTPVSKPSSRAPSTTSRAPSTTARAPSVLRGTTTHSRTASTTSNIPSRPATATALRRPTQIARPAPVVRARSGTVSTAAAATPKPRPTRAASVSRPAATTVSRPAATAVSRPGAKSTAATTGAANRAGGRVTGAGDRAASIPSRVTGGKKIVPKDDDPFKFDVDGLVGEDFMFEV